MKQVLVYATSKQFGKYKLHINLHIMSPIKSPKKITKIAVLAADTLYCLATLDAEQLFPTSEMFAKSLANSALSPRGLSLITRYYFVLFLIVPALGGANCI